MIRTWPYLPGAVCSALRKLRIFDDQKSVCDLKHTQCFDATESASLVWYIREELLEVQVWLSPKTDSQGREGRSDLPRKRDRLVGATFIDISPLLEQRAKMQLQLRYNK